MNNGRRANGKGDTNNENDSPETLHPNWQSYAETKNKSEVLRHLQATGWDVKKQTFYNHCSEGKLKVNKLGVYSRLALRRYAETWLVHTQAEGLSTVEIAENLAASKIKKEMLRLDVVTERERFGLDIDKKRYILRTDVDSELAARAVALNNGLEYFFHSSLAEIILIVGGDQQRGPDLLEYLLAKKDELLNEYAVMGDFTVIVDNE